MLPPPRSFTVAILVTGIILYYTKKIFYIRFYLILGTISVIDNLGQNVQYTATVNIRPVEVDHIVNRHVDLRITGINRNCSSGIAVGVVFTCVCVSVNIIFYSGLVGLINPNRPIIIKVNFIFSVSPITQNSQAQLSTIAISTH